MKWLFISSVVRSCCSDVARQGKYHSFGCLTHSMFDPLLTGPKHKRMRVSYPQLEPINSAIEDGFAFHDVAIVAVPRH